MTRLVIFLRNYLSLTDSGEGSLSDEYNYLHDRAHEPRNDLNTRLTTSAAAMSRTWVARDCFGQVKKAEFPFKWQRGITKRGSSCPKGSVGSAGGAGPELQDGRCHTEGAGSARRPQAAPQRTLTPDLSRGGRN